MTPQPPVLLIHGMGCGPWVWDDVQRHAPDIDFLAATIAGHRGGARLDATSSISATEQMVDDLELQLDARGIEKTLVVGNSLGGWLGLRLAERGRASAVLCLAPAGGWIPGGPQERRLLRQFMRGRAFARRVTTHPRLLGIPAVRRAAMHPVAQTNAAASLASTTAMMRDLADCQALEVGAHDPTTRQMSRIDHIDVPVQIIWSAADRVLDGEWAKVRYQSLRASVDTLPGVGHVAMLDAPRTVASLIRKQRESAQSGPLTA